MPPFQRGQVIRATDLNATAADAAAGGNLVGGGVEVARGPGGTGITFIRPSVPRPNAAHCEYIGVTNVPLYGVVEVYEGWSSHAEKAVGKCRIPSESGFARIGAALKGASTANVVWVQIKGIGHVLFDYASVPAHYQGRTRYRLGGKKDSHIAQYDQLGPFTLIKDLGNLWGAYNLGVVEFTGLRGDSKIADTQLSDEEDGPYKTYVWGVGYTVTETSPGQVYVALT